MNRNWFLLKVFLLVIFCLLLTAPACLSENSSSYTTEYKCADLSGAPRWSARAFITHIEGEPDDIFLLTEKGAGIYSGFKDEVSWVSTLKFKSDKESVKPIRMEKRVFDSNKKLLAMDTQEFDYDNNKIVVRKKDEAKNRQTERSFSFSSDPVNRLSLSLYIQKFLENGIRQKRAALLTSEPNLYSVEIKIIDEETIGIHNKQLPAYKMCLDPNLGLLSIFKVFLPKSYTWHLAEGDFAWLKYQGPENDPASIKVVIETRG